MRRREFLTISAGAIGASALYILTRESGPLERRGANVVVPLRFFTAKEARVVTAACESIFPRDASGPGAMDAGVVIYIDRQLAGPYGRDKYRYVKPPFVTSVPEHGYQGKENPRQIYRAGIRDLGNFNKLSTDEQIRKLKEIETSSFFQLLRRHTIEGLFSDPMHGGNIGLVGWALIGYPGPQWSYREDIDQHFGQAWRPKATTVEQLMGRVPPLLEDESD
jgi:gluconate 2-dehydrogenase gamma chain